MAALTPAEVDHFMAFGFVARRQLFSPAEMQTISTEFDAAMGAARQYGAGDAGSAFDGSARVSADMSQVWSGRPFVGALAEDDRVQIPITQLLGPGYSGGLGDGNLYVGDTEWHPDLGWDPSIPDGRSDPARLADLKPGKYVRYQPSIKVALYLDPVGRDSGAIRLLPGSHLSPQHEAFWSLHLDGPSWAARDPELCARLRDMWLRDGGEPAEFEQNVRAGAEQVETPVHRWTERNTFGLAPEDIPAFAVESSPGDVVFFSHQTWHASFGGATGRRMFTLNFRCRSDTRDPPKDWSWADMPLPRL